MSTATALWTNAAKLPLVNLASKAIGTSLPLDAIQEELNMSRPFVYMAGLVVVVAAGSDGASSPGSSVYKRPKVSVSTTSDSVS
jgi:hypothetical protein